MTSTGGDPPLATSQAIRQWADEDHASVVALTQQLVQIPTRGGVDPYAPILDVMLTWFSDHDLAARPLHDNTTGQVVGVVCDVAGTDPGPRYVLDACIDTAPFGDLAAWRHPPTSGAIEDGWMFGRGTADSKAAVAIFAHIAARMRRQADRLQGTLTVLLDADEHTGGFGGAKTYFGGPGAPDDVAGVMIGYPGTDKIVVGGRGFLRARMTVRGESGHTGSESSAGNGNAVEKASRLVAMLARRRTPAPVDPSIGLPPRMTVTAIHGGESFSIVPDHCIVDVDVRLTTQFNAELARAAIEHLAKELDASCPTTRATAVDFQDSWPAYHLAESALIRIELTRAAARHLPQPTPTKVAGPSNIGNYLARLGIDATAGFGVGYAGLHGTDERIDLSTIPMIQASYHEAVLALLVPRPSPPPGRRSRKIRISGRNP
ncbi:MAG: hypothetical protein AUI14_17525 [Actinobacteria bacterium 13_2_20CM_2_71_6]|nr:MAG: hypothetical protein AUI14_17525 [Actinobacteria bacterium 13_2_20CM_2_71_6]